MLILGDYFRLSGSVRITWVLESRRSRQNIEAEEMHWRDKAEREACERYENTIIGFERGQKPGNMGSSR